jgi:hypothetical protein
MYWATFFHDTLGAEPDRLDLHVEMQGLCLPESEHASTASHKSLICTVSACPELPKSRPETHIILLPLRLSHTLLFGLG